MEKFEQLQITEAELQQELNIMVEKGLIEKATDEHGREVYKIREETGETQRGIAVIGGVDEDELDGYA